MFGYDSIGRLNAGWVCTGSPAANCSGSTVRYGFTTASSGVRLTGSFDSVLNQNATYQYDEFNRVKSRTINSVQDMSWVYDRYGNRWQQSASNGPQPQYSFNAASNQISTGGYIYDAAGNMTNDGFHAYTYDAEGNITTVDGGQTAQYTFDALNQRVRTVANGKTTDFVFNAAGQRVSEWDGTTHAQNKGKYYWGGMPVAYYSGGFAHFEHQDWEGTERVRTAYNGGVEDTFRSLPFGDSQTTASGTDTDSYHYALLDHDSETNADHAQFRQYSNTQGHWQSPDPYSASYDPFTPQSLNRYAYVVNNHSLPIQGEPEGGT